MEQGEIGKEMKKDAKEMRGNKEGRRIRTKYNIYIYINIIYDGKCGRVGMEEENGKGEG